MAARLYADRVATPALTRPDGLPRLWALCDGWIAFMRSGELTGRSFFLTALVEYDARPGVVRDVLVRYRGRWERLFTGCWADAERLGHVRAGVDGRQMFFEVSGLVAAATLDSQLCDDLTVFDRARAGVLDRLRPLVVDHSVLPA